MDNFTDDELLDALGIEQETVKTSSYSLREQRIINGFKEIQQFFEQHGKVPSRDPENDIFEKMYAVRLNRLRMQEESRLLLTSIDYQGLLNMTEVLSVSKVEEIDDDDLLAELNEGNDQEDISELRHVRSQVEIRAAEEIAKREKCEDFDRFKPLFEQAERELKSGFRETRPFGKDASIELGNFFVLGGQFAYVAEKGNEFKTPSGDYDARLRVIYSNGTESNLLLRSLQRALYKDSAGRRLTEADAGPLFSQEWDNEDIESGTIYVLRSLSEHPFVQENQKLVHKIGVTGGKVETRIANAAHDATYLLADVELVASYKLVGINRIKLEKVLHRIFAPAQLDLTIADRFGRPVRPREWFLVPLHVIDAAVQHIQDGTITDMAYDVETASLIKSH